MGHIYIVIAYRWGWTNNHWYIVHAGLDEETALEAAREEAEGRGGKYGCAVYIVDHEGIHKCVDYFSAGYDEDKPYRNYRIDMFSDIGHAAVDAAKGRIWVPEEGDSGKLKAVEVDPPEWLVGIVKRAEAHAEKMDEVFNGRTRDTDSEKNEDEV